MAEVRVLCVDWGDVDFGNGLPKLAMWAITVHWVKPLQHPDFSRAASGATWKITHHGFWERLF